PRIAPYTPPYFSSPPSHLPITVRAPIITFSCRLDNLTAPRAALEHASFTCHHLTLAFAFSIIVLPCLIHRSALSSANSRDRVIVYPLNPETKNHSVPRMRSLIWRIAA